MLFRDRFYWTVSQNICFCDWLERRDDITSVLFPSFYRVPQKRTLTSSCPLSGPFSLGPRGFSYSVDCPHGFNLRKTSTLTRSRTVLTGMAATTKASLKGTFPKRCYCGTSKVWRNVSETGPEVQEYYFVKDIFVLDILEVENL